MNQFFGRRFKVIPTQKLHRSYLKIGDLVEVHLIDPARIEILDADGVRMDTKKITAEDFSGED